MAEIFIIFTPPSTSLSEQKPGQRNCQSMRMREGEMERGRERLNYNCCKWFEKLRNKGQRGTNANVSSS